MSKALTKKYLDDNFINVIFTSDGNVRVFQKDMKTEEIKERVVYKGTRTYKCGTSLTYMLVNLYDFAEKKWTNISIQRLVYVTCIGDIPEGYDVDHIDDDSLNNRADNLQLLTRKENIEKSKSRGCNHGHSIKCIELDKEFISVIQASKELNITMHYIRETLKGNNPKKAKYHFNYVA